MKRLFSEERERIITDLLQQQGKVSIDEIASVLSVSLSTARLQLQKMNDNGLLIRTHGGAVKIDHMQPPRKEKFFREITNLEKKLQIASAAVETINDGDFIAISSGTTTYMLATMLQDKKNLTVVTDSVPIAYELLFGHNVRLFICGGEVQARNGACQGQTAEGFFNSLRVDKSYCSVDSIDLEFGITSIDIYPRAERALFYSAKERYVLADSTKFLVRPFFEKIADLREISHLISDSSLDLKLQDQLKEHGVHLMIGKETPQES